jgi:hypothetical protein
VRLPPIADAIAPGIVLAQAVGRWGNWFNNELYGDPTTKPWGLTIHCMDDSTRQATACSGVPGTTTIAGHFQPTFLYESVWCVIVAILIIWADRRFNLGHGRVFASYVLAYTVGRGWIEHLRSDYAHHIAGLRLNDWTAILVGFAALVYLILGTRLRPGREAPEEMYWPHFESLSPAGEAQSAEDGSRSAAEGAAQSPVEVPVEDVAEEPEAPQAPGEPTEPQEETARETPATEETPAGEADRDNQPAEP